MTTEIINGITVLRPADGKTLTNGTVTSDEVWVGNDTWWEIDKPPEDEIGEDAPMPMEMPTGEEV